MSYEFKVGDRVRVLRHRNLFGVSLNVVKGLGLPSGVEVELKAVCTPLGSDMEEVDFTLFTTAHAGVDYVVRSDDIELISSKDLAMEEIFGTKGVKYDSTVSKSVRSCAVCKGTGFYSYEELTNYHKNEYTTFDKECSCCDGCGRLTVTTYSVRFMSESIGIESHTFTREAAVPFDRDPINSPHKFIREHRSYGRLVKEME